MNQKKFQAGLAFTTVILLLIGLSIACGGGSSESDFEKKSDLELLDWKITTGEYGNTTITGRVKNNTSRELSYAQIQFNLYDASGAQVGTAMANVNNLEPNGIWKFEAVCLEDNFKTAKFKELTGF